MQTMQDAINAAIQQRAKTMTPPKRTRKTYDYKTKADVIRRFKAGESTSFISGETGVALGRVQAWVKAARSKPRGAPMVRGPYKKKAAAEVYVQAAKVMDEASAKQRGILSLVHVVVTSASFSPQVKIDMIKALLQ
jgi:transposase-like protein